MMSWPVWSFWVTVALVDFPDSALQPEAAGPGEGACAALVRSSLLPLVRISLLLWASLFLC